MWGIECEFGVDGAAGCVCWKIDNDVLLALSGRPSDACGTRCASKRYPCSPVLETLGEPLLPNQKQRITETLCIIAKT